jgi:hypothetical protein
VGAFSAGKAFSAKAESGTLIIQNFNKAEA